MTASQRYFKINVMPVNQIQTGLVFVGKITFEQLFAIHRLTERKEDWSADPFFDSKKNVSTKQSDEEFQRQLSPAKVNKITEFVRRGLENRKNNESIELFPTSIILSLDHDEEYDSDSFDESSLTEAHSDELTGCFISQDKAHIFIPKNRGIALIVDGQHRFYGVKRLYESLLAETDKKIIENIEFITTFLVGFDIYELGRVFATVNFEQKPVNRSLYYDIFGSLPETERNDIKLAHDLALHLNNNENSPIRNMIKMLGKGHGLFSQAFFVENMLLHFKEKGVWEKIYTDYLMEGKAFKKIPVFMRMYLSCIKEVYSPAWPQPTESDGRQVYSPYRYDFILCKTTGLAAFFRLIKDVYPLVDLLSDMQMKEKIIGILKRISAEDAVRIFSKEGEFGGGGSLGRQKRLYEFLKSKLRISQE